MTIAVKVRGKYQDIQRKANGAKIPRVVERYLEGEESHLSESCIVVL